MKEDQAEVGAEEEEVYSIMSDYIIIRGPLGCGKTILAQKLSEILSAKYFSIDQILDKHNLTKDKEQGYISRKSFLRANKLIIPKIRRELDRGIPVIIDGNFYWKSQLQDLIKQLAYPHFVFTLKAPLAVCVQRDSQREKPHGQDAVKAIYKKVTEFEYGTVIDINKPLSVALAEIVAYIQKKP